MKAFSPKNTRVRLTFYHRIYHRIKKGRTSSKYKILMFQQSFLLQLILNDLFFQYFIDFTIMESRFQVYVFKIGVFPYSRQVCFLYKGNTSHSESRIFISFNVLFLFLFLSKKYFRCNFIIGKRKKTGFVRDFKSNSFVYLK